MIVTHVQIAEVGVKNIPGQVATELRDALTSSPVFTGRVGSSTTSGMGRTNTDGELLFSLTEPIYAVDALNTCLMIHRFIKQWLLGHADDCDLEQVTLHMTVLDVKRDGHPKVKLTFGADYELHAEDVDLPQHAKLETLAITKVTGHGFGTLGFVALDEALLAWTATKADPGFLSDYDQLEHRVWAEFSSNWMFPGNGAYALALSWLNAMLAAEPETVAPGAPRRVEIEAFDAHYHSGKTPTYTVMAIEGEPYDVTWVRVMSTRTDGDFTGNLSVLIADTLAPADAIQVEPVRVVPIKNTPYHYVVFTVATQVKSSLPGAKALAKALLARVLELDPVAESENTGVEGLVVRLAVAGGWDKDYDGSKDFYPNGEAYHALNVRAKEAPAAA